MPILERAELARPSVHSVRELRVPIARERLTSVSEFYADVLGLIPWPTHQQVPGGWGAGDLRRGIYFQYRHDPPVDPMRRRLTLVVASLEAVELRLRARGWEFERHRGLDATDQCLLLNDPIGHRIEVRQFRPI